MLHSVCARVRMANEKVLSNSNKTREAAAATEERAMQREHNEVYLHTFICQAHETYTNTLIQYLLSFYTLEAIFLRPVFK